MPKINNSKLKILKSLKIHKVNQVSLYLLKHFRMLQLQNMF